MAEWAPKRFWKAVSVVTVDGGFAVHLDGRPLRTPAKAALILPTEAMARAIAAEWDAQTGKVDPGTMPCTRAANSALDKLVPQKDAVVALLADYGGSDLLCYRAEAPPELAARQAAGWDPLLDWAATTLRAPLRATAGVMHIAQDPASLDRLTAATAGLDPFRLAAFHDLVAISGSLVLALAVLHGRLSAEEAFDLSRIDEHWQIEQWGADEEAAETEAAKRAAFAQAHRFLELCR